MIHRLGLAALALLLLASVHAAEYEDTLGTHVVEDGDTLWSITERYLGADFLWRENWKLNPDIEDPHFLVPGQRLVVIKERKITADRAEVRAVSNEVEKNLQRSAWIEAQAGDELAQRDGLRTLEDSSAELRFTDASLLRLSEFSQIYLETKQSDLRGRDSGRVEVEQGMADLEFEPMAPRRQADIELVAGAAVARPQPTSDGTGRYRARRDQESGEASFMVFEGSTTLESGGETIEVEAGMGTSVSATGEVREPEKLLDAPTGLAPADGAVWVAANQGLSWDPVEGAARYVVEICRDAECGVLIQRHTELTEARWEPELRRGGQFYWRVTPVSETGLEGFGSRPQGFELPAPVVDRQPPVVAIVPIGAARAHERNTVLIGATTRLRFLAWDDASGIESVEYRSRSASWLVWDGEDLPLSAFDGNEIEVRSTDRLGRRSEVFRARLGELR